MIDGRSQGGGSNDGRAQAAYGDGGWRAGRVYWAGHGIAAELDGEIELVAGAFSQSAERSREAGVKFHIDSARAYADYRQMIEVESKRPDGIDFVAIVTPNHLHLPIALAALEAGIPVMSDKPATATYEEALKLEAAVKKASVPYGLTHTYAGYQMVREARAMCAAGKLGKIRKVAVEYFQGWLSRPIESTGQRQAAWRTDPERNGPGGAISNTWLCRCFVQLVGLADRSGRQRDHVDDKSRGRADDDDLARAGDRGGRSDRDDRDRAWILRGRGWALSSSHLPQ